MSDRLVTVATYTEPTSAHLAREQLEAAGVRCFLTDDQTTGMDWLLGNAIGWVKLQVAESDAQRAVAILENLRPVAAPEPTAITEAGPAGEPPPRSDEEEEEENERSRQANRAYRAALLGLLFCPLEVYATVLLWDVYSSKEPLTEEARRRFVYAALINLSLLAALVLGILIMVVSSLDL
jgi:hypothetical protein